MKRRQLPDGIFEDAGNPEVLKDKDETARKFQESLREVERDVPQPLPDFPYDRED